MVFLFLQLYRKPWTEGQYKLADKVGLSRLSVLEALKTLEGQDYIVKRQNPERRNHQIVELKETKNG